MSIADMIGSQMVEKWRDVAPQKRNGARLRRAVQKVTKGGFLDEADGETGQGGGGSGEGCPPKGK